jgi:hypothetical protein
MSDQDKIAAVLNDWLSEHGYPTAGLGRNALVSVGWLRGELAKIRAGNPSKGTAVESRRWNRAVDEVVRVLDDFERRGPTPTESEAP